MNKTEILKLFEKELLQCLPDSNCYEKKVIDSMKYSLTVGGKRVRPLLVFYFALLCGGTVENAMPFACAVEMIHTYSLIHDDLPCMDNDDLRRGKPSNHIVFGEDTALLAGDALQSLAFSTIASRRSLEILGFEKAAKGVSILSKHCGALGMVGGQMIDIENVNNDMTLEMLDILNNKKTGDLIAAACELGCLSANAGDEIISLAGEYGKLIGLAFQIRDDMLDVISDEKTLGKPIGSDKENNKKTYAAVLGIEKCREAVSLYTKQAIEILKKINGNTKELEEFTLSLENRKN